MDSEDGGKEGGGERGEGGTAWLKNGEQREGEMWASRGNEREREKKRERRGWRFSPASINHLRERMGWGVNVCVHTCIHTLTHVQRFSSDTLTNTLSHTHTHSYTQTQQSRAVNKTNSLRP